MSTIAEIIDGLCAQRGITGNKMCLDLGLSRSTLTELRKGRAKSIKIETAQKIAGYFDVSVDYLLGKTDKKEKAPAEAEALVNGDPELTEYLEELRTRDEMRMLFSITKGATKEDVMRAVAIIEALRREEEGR